jgi:hypothetical protein
LARSKVKEVQMNKIILYCSGSFIGGAAIAALATWKLLEKRIDKKYSDIAQKEIDSVKEKFTVPRVKKNESEKIPGEEKTEKFLKSIMDKPSLSEYARKLKDGGYTNYSNVKDEPEVKKDEPDDGIHIITPDDFGDNEDYDQISLTLYADGILADEDDTIINAEEVVGDALEHIGEYEDDAIHVCNPIRKAYYEVLTDNRSYEDATGKTPHHDGEEDK